MIYNKKIDVLCRYNEQVQLICFIMNFTGGHRGPEFLLGAVAPCLPWNRPCIAVLIILLSNQQTEAKA